MAEEEQIKTWLKQAGFHIEHFTLIASDPVEPVYKFVSEDQEYFAKILSDEKGKAMKSVLQKGLQIKMPQSTLLQKDKYILVMESASGSTLSLLIPICFFPGLWQYYSQSLLTASEEVGVALRDLHAGTFDDIKPIKISSCRMANRLNVASSIQNKFGEDIVHHLNSLFKEVADEQFPHVRIHGDPTPHNIFWNIGTEEISIIDFNLHSSVAVEDLVVFEVGVELMSARLPFSRSSQSDAVIDQFRSGYNSKDVHGTFSERDIKILKLAYYTHLLDKHLRHVSPDTTRQRLTQFTDRRIIEKKVRSLTSNL